MLYYEMDKIQGISASYRCQILEEHGSTKKKAVLVLCIMGFVWDNDTREEFG